MTPVADNPGQFQASWSAPKVGAYLTEVTAQRVDRTTGKEGMTGTAVGFDGAFVLNVSNSDGRAPIGVLGLFIPDGNGFLGVWAKAGTDRLGAEHEL